MTVSEATGRQDTATEDSEKIAAGGRSTLTVPAVFESQGFEAMPFGYGNLWAVDEDCYIYKPLRAWDAAQALVDELVARTGGNIYTLVSAVMETMSAVASIEPEEGESREQVGRVRGLTWQRMSSQNWASFLAACPAFKPAEFAKSMVERCDVRRLPSTAEQAKAADDPTKDHGGKLFKATGAGSVDNYYKGRRDQIVRIGLAAAWGSCGDFFGVR